MSKSRYQAPKGTRDIMVPESNRISSVLKVFEDTLNSGGYGQIISPLFEEIGVFQRIGGSSEVVTKEMFDFYDKDPKSPQHLALRPELTASICRAFAQHRPVTPWKVWYQGPQFRYEKPQAGRYRQFLQVGAELLGTPDPHADIEIIAIASNFFRKIGLSGIKLLLNSLGDANSRKSYNKALVEYFASNQEDLSEQSQETMLKNPLRVLDSKRQEDQGVIEGAPLITDFLNSDSVNHFHIVQDGLSLLGIDYELTPRLVRGLDYYTKTTFEFVAPNLDSAQNAVGGGGRYDGLVEALGGPPTEGIGFAIGIERTLMACEAENILDSSVQSLEVFIVDTTGGKEALVLSEELRQIGIRVDRSFDQRSMKAQMKAADRSGAELAIIIGTDELNENQVTLRDLRGEGTQTVLDRQSLSKKLPKILEETRK
ncbi:MAG: histidine--tRNA ligase [Acidimicrobiaceae bacterium]|jgi:histidyl-tRNA synthetase|nr:histidine--tRNA ligase [Acidimicrobiaceae bacterium]|tara:strand:+ start:108135 stop:109415 length:1281 start_codon:yes stop_codon:yes gene_type:complete